MHLVQLVILQLKYFTNFKNKMYQFLWIFEPLILLLTLYFMFKLKGLPITNQYILAIGLLNSWIYVLYSSGSSLTSEKFKGTLELLITSNTPLYKVILSKAICNTLVGFFSFMFTYFYGLILFSINIDINNVQYLILSLISVFVSMVSLGITFAVLFVSFKNIYAFQNLILYPIPILTGVFYSIDNFPVYLKIISNLMPLTWSIRALYLPFNSSFEFHIYKELIFNALFISIIYFICCYYFIKKAEGRLKLTGNMGEN
ncbi:ABC transporter permease [Bacillus fungorum]|uniref:ABC transporter permease n=1 Tax=Bacillus fungorum TaxID=2039284 RepID=UPI003392D5C5